LLPRLKLTKIKKITIRSNEWLQFIEKYIKEEKKRKKKKRKKEIG